MRWLDIVLSATAVADLVLAAVSALWLFDYMVQARTRSRRVGAASLCLVCAGLSLEAAFFLAQEAFGEGWPRELAMLAVRLALLVAMTFLAAVIWRGVPRRA